MRVGEVVYVRLEPGADDLFAFCRRVARAAGRRHLSARATRQDAFEPHRVRVRHRSAFFAPKERALTLETWPAWRRRRRPHGDRPRTGGAQGCRSESGSRPCPGPEFRVIAVGLSGRPTRPRTLHAPAPRTRWCPLSVGRPDCQDDSVRRPRRSVSPMAWISRPVTQSVERKVGAHLLGKGLHPVAELDSGRIGDPDHAFEIRRNRRSVGDAGITHLGAERLHGRTREGYLAAIDDGGREFEQRPPVAELRCRWWDRPAPGRSPPHRSILPLSRSSAAWALVQ